MPELPEVEVTRRGFAQALDGARVLSARLGKPLRWPLGRPAAELAGARLGEAQRRGKYIWLPLAQADGDEGGLLMHLGMSGSLALLGSPPPAGPHDHFDLVTNHGTLRLNDPRRFGAVVWSPSLALPPAGTLLQRLGAEPFDAALLLAGDVVVGAGNIYACEALFQAGIHPALRADRISRPRALRLLAALRQTLGRALELGGSTLRDFTDVHGASGAYQAEAGVYGREGQPCPRCGGAVRRVTQAQRSTYFCAVCQRR
jgi:formamidopyrimidine-DNA glycosylase